MCFFILNCCDGKTIFLNADWLCGSMIVLKCNLAMPSLRHLFILRLFGTNHDICLKNFVLLLRNKCVLLLEKKSSGPNHLSPTTISMALLYKCNLHFGMTSDCSPGCSKLGISPIPDLHFSP